MGGRCPYFSDEGTEGEAIGGTAYSSVSRRAAPRKNASPYPEQRNAPPA